MADQYISQFTCINCDNSKVLKGRKIDSFTVYQNAVHQLGWIIKKIDNDYKLFCSDDCVKSFSKDEN